MKTEDRKIVDLLIENTVDLIINGGNVDGGHNGPYFDYEKAGRNISHWICTFCSYYEKTHNQKYKTAVKVLAEYFYSGQDYTDAGVYYCRDKEKKDHVNGTIGAAWIIEGMVEAAKVLKDERLLDRAINLFKAFPYDQNNGMWERIEIDGKNLGLDITYNHQLWFAASGAEILQYRYDADIDRMIIGFLDRSRKTFWVMPSGVICHFANCYINTIQCLKNQIKYLKHCAEIAFKSPSLEYKEIGYHLFDMYGFSLLQDRYKNHPLFQTMKYKRALKYCLSNDYSKKLIEMQRSADSTGLVCDNVDEDINSYGFPYNSPAFELPFILEKHGLNDNDLCDKFFSIQRERTYDERKKCFGMNTEDPLVLNARIYELVRSNWFWEGLN